MSHVDDDSYFCKYDFLDTVIPRPDNSSLCSKSRSCYVPIEEIFSPVQENIDDNSELKELFSYIGNEIIRYLPEYGDPHTYPETSKIYKDKITKRLTLERKKRITR